MMKLHNILIPAAALALSACAIPTGPVEVTRFHRAAEGIVYGSGSYAVKAASGPSGEQGLMLSPYLTAVAREMQRVGYSEKFDGSDVIAEVSVDVRKVQAARRSPVSVGVGGSTGSYGSGVGLGLGIDLGSLTQGDRIETQMRVRILRRTDSLVIWEGRAAQSAGAKSPAAQPGIAASKLAESLFKDFPGESGKTITVP
jgi:Domain of unknown function (DUF4136)